MDFIEFGSFEEMQEKMRQAESAANANLKPWQIEIRDDYVNDRYWARYADGIWIFGHCWSTDTARMQMRGMKLSESEIREDLEAIRMRRKRGYIFGRAWSIACPEGEAGDTHVSQIIPITHEMFLEAKAAHWDVILTLKDR